jgi:hypothetical protein
MISNHPWPPLGSLNPPAGSGPIERSIREYLLDLRPIASEPLDERGFLERLDDPWTIVHRFADAHPGTLGDRFLYRVSGVGVRDYWSLTDLSRLPSPPERHRDLFPVSLSSLYDSVIEVSIVTGGPASGQIWPVDIHRYRGQDLDQRPLFERLAVLEQVISDLGPGSTSRPWVGLWPVDLPHLLKVVVHGAVPGTPRFLVRDLRAGYHDGPDWRWFPGRSGIDADLATHLAARR